MLRGEGHADALAERDAGVDLDRPEVCRYCEDFEAMDVDCAYVDSLGTYFEQRSCGECCNTRIREIEGSPSVRLVQLLMVNDEQPSPRAPEDRRRRQLTSECIRKTFDEVLKQGIDVRRVKLARAGLSEALQMFTLQRYDSARFHAQRAFSQLDFALEKVEPRNPALKLDDDSVPSQMGGGRG